MFLVKDFLRTIRSWPFWATQLLGLFFLFIDWSQDFLEPLLTHAQRYDLNAYDVWRRSITIFVPFAPLLATLPYADSYVRERDQGFARYALLRMKYGHYIGAKFLLNGLLGATAVALPLLLFFLFTSLLYPRTLPPLSATPYTEAWMWAYGFLGDWFIPQPTLYILARLGLAGLFGATYATLGMAISPFTKHRYVVLAFPFIFFWLFGFAVNIAGIPVWWSMYVLMPDAILDSNQRTIFLPIIGLLLICGIVANLFMRKYSSRFVY